MLIAAILLVIGAMGWALGRVRPRLNLTMAVLAVFAAILFVGAILLGAF